MRPFVVLTLLVGCDQLFGLQGVQDPSADAPPPIACFTDSFDDGVIAGQWTVMRDSTESPVAVREAGGTLEIELAASAVNNAFNGIATLVRYDLTGAAAQIEFVAPPTNQSKVETFLSIGRDSQNYYSLDYEANALSFYSTINSARTSTDITYVAKSHKYLQLRHDTAGASMVFETSADGVIWTAHRTIAAEIPLDAMAISIQAGTYGGGVASPGTARYDNFALTGPACP